MMIIYTLSIEDQVKTEGRVTERAVMVNSTNDNTYQEVYNPSAENKKPSNHEDREFDTPFSIVHPFRNVARRIVEDDDKYNVSESSFKPKMRYCGSVNDAQRALFETILAQEYEAYAEKETDALKKDPLCQRVSPD